MFSIEKKAFVQEQSCKRILKGTDSQSSLGPLLAKTDAKSQAAFIQT